MYTRQPFSSAEIWSFYCTETENIDFLNYISNIFPSLKLQPKEKAQLSEKASVRSLPKRVPSVATSLRPETKATVTVVGNFTVSKLL